MSAFCCENDPDPGGQVTKTQRRALWVALVINAVMFGVELTGGLIGKSVGLQADAVDFFGDAANYGLSLSVLGMGLAVRSRVALVKGVTMLAFGLWVAGMLIYHSVNHSLPSAPLMGGIGLVALAANIVCAAILFRFRGHDANMKSVWICSRNDALSNIAVIIAASGVWASGTGIPDLIVGGLIGALAVWGGVTVIRAALAEHRDARRTHHHDFRPAAEIGDD
ncbi:MAG: cation transporter [Rhodospirillales bacterium]|nr:cation transporter [Rhodospirillales bacterium]MBO6785378.1 cation transporter [Rhodospirillales bacterium]